ncbi:MAG: response regulator transcription factor [Candidatus Omnitrophica bacterium]|nr:response regulator transcription factor [Candidatus Omnitrophota bacterium]MDE2008683.1 response regulator transcription factor [Candidatus Omnitrophota bacterium]MDE2214824.1 response regulator transcription factor [Candidatus Omnitrophota bacterium]MDE2231944.1 response regulator transcription factor [Candidatus Omnitrophota bacterium]
MRILVVEDEKSIAAFLARGLKEEKFAVDVAYDGEEGMYLAQINSYDVMIFDIMLPKKDGVAMCRELRAKKINTPILMLTARNAVEDKINGLNSGADDYLTKPFSFGELLARVRVLLKRPTDNKTSVLKVEDLELNQLTFEVKRGRKPLKLNAKEYMLLQYLMLNAGHVISRTMISEHVWNEEFDSMTNVIDVYIAYLRRKIDRSFKKKLIRTIRGAGYMLGNPQ